MRTPVDPLRKDEASIRRRSAWRPIVGLLMVGAVAAITVIGTPWIAERAWFALRPAGLDYGNFQLLVGFATFMILILIFATLFALGAPRSKPKVTESYLKAERELLWIEEEERRKRQRQIRQKMSQSRREDE